jgi:hypothetical protein
MLAELDVLVYLRVQDDLDRVAQRLFGALRSQAVPANDEEWGGECYKSTGLGLEGVLYRHTGDLFDPEFEAYQYGLEITAHFWCVDLDAVDLEGPLSEYYARMIAFELNLETATEVLLETTEEAEVFKIMAYRRNPQFRLDQAPTTPKVFMIEEREVARPFDYEEETGFLDEEAEEDSIESEDEDAT